MLFLVRFSHSLPHRSRTAFVLSAKAGETLTWPSNIVHTVVTISEKLQLGMCVYDDLNGPQDNALGGDAAAAAVAGAPNTAMAARLARARDVPQGGARRVRQRTT